MRIIVITGMSGSGKSTAVKVLEDDGFYCIDNLPVSLFEQFVDLVSRSGESYSGICLVADIRGKEFLQGYATAFRRFKDAGHAVEVLYFDATDEVLVRRFSETRRRHPVHGQYTVAEGIRMEREYLSSLRMVATRVIDTSEFNVHQLKDFLMRVVRGEEQASPLMIEIQSFGFRYGLPPESSVVMDVRFLSNPFFVPELKEKTGLDDAVRDYVLDNPQTGEFLDRFFPLLDLLVTANRKEGKAYMTVSIGCTGGRHRSVAIAEATAARLREKWRSVRVTHRDIEKGNP